MDEVQGNLGNYQAVAALPSFTLFPWFFVIPGVLIAGCGHRCAGPPASRAPLGPLGPRGPWASA